MPISQRQLPFDRLEVGDMFMVEMREKTLRSYASRYGKELGRKFRVRIVTGLEGDTNKLGVWRVK